MPRKKKIVSFTVSKVILAKLDHAVNTVVSEGSVQWFAPHYRSALIEAAIDHYLECENGFKKILSINAVKLPKKGE